MLNAILRAATPSPCALPSGTLVAAQPSGLLECHGHGLSPSQAEEAAWEG